jgi:hypothetical protein
VPHPYYQDGFDDDEAHHAAATADIDEVFAFLGQLTLDVARIEAVAREGLLEPRLVAETGSIARLVRWILSDENDGPILTGGAEVVHAPG